MDFGPLSELYVYLVAIASSFLLAWFNKATGWKAALGGSDLLKSLQPLAVAVIALIVNFVAGLLNIDAALGMECFVGGVAESCNAFATAVAAAVIAIPFREIMARLPFAKVLFAA